MEFVSTMDSFQDSLLMARPRDIFGFAVRYFQDEKAANPEEAHAVHMLPFLVYNNHQFKSAACTIFCFITNTDPNCRIYLDSATVCNIVQRMKLDTLGLRLKSIDELVRARIMTLKRVDFNLFVSCLRLPLACYQIVIWLQDRLLIMMEEANKDSSNSGTGVSLLARSQLSATTTTTTKTVSTASVAANATEEDKGGSNCYVGHACLQLVPLKTIELHRIKQCLQKEQQLGYAKSPPSPSRPSAASSSSISSSSKYPSSANHKADHWARHRSSAYHMHGCLDLSTDADGTARTGTGGGVALSEGEVRMLTKLLTSTVDGLIDSGGPNVIPSEVLLDSFMSRYLKQLPPTS